MNGFTKYLRLLPAVVIVGTSLLAIKGIDLARAAQAPEQASDQPDNSGLAPSDAGGTAATHDFAGDEGASGSASEVDVLSSLTRRRAELDARERALAMRENLLIAGEGRVDQKIGALKTLQTQIQALLAERDTKQDDQIKSLIKSYGPDGMAPKKAAAIFNTMPDEVLIPIAKGMKPADLGSILQAMNPDAAQRLTVKLASLLKLPEPPPVVCPTASGATADIASPVPGTPVSAAPPQQTAALSPPGSTPVVSPLPTPPAPPAQTPPAATPPAAPPAQASTPPKPHAPPVHHPAATPPAKPATAAATPPAKPTTASATPPAKPATPPASLPAKPTAAAATPAVTPSAQPATTPPAKPASQAASGPPAPLTPAKGG